MGGLLRPCLVETHDNWPPREIWLVFWAAKLCSRTGSTCEPADSSLSDAAPGPQLRPCLVLPAAAAAAACCFR